MSSHLKSLLEQVDLQPETLATLKGADPVLPSRFRVGEAAATALGASGLAANEIWKLSGGASQDVSVDIKGAQHVRELVVREVRRRERRRQTQLHAAPVLVVTLALAGRLPMRWASSEPVDGGLPEVFGWLRQVGRLFCWRTSLLRAWIFRRLARW